MEPTVADICAVRAVVEANSDLVLSPLLRLRKTDESRLTSTTAFSYEKSSVSVISQYSPTTRSQGSVSVFSSTLRPRTYGTSNETEH